MEIDASPTTETSLPPERVAELLDEGGIQMIAAAFRESGWEAYNMDGGLRAWQERGLPLESDGGHSVGA